MSSTQNKPTKASSLSLVDFAGCEVAGIGRYQEVVADGGVDRDVLRVMLLIPGSNIQRYNACPKQGVVADRGVDRGR